jgi:N-formylglutamate amidohydrolase
VAAFDVVAPTNPRPVLVEVPHAGMLVPDDVREELSLPPDSMHRDADIYVDRLYARAPQQGATLLVAQVSRYVVDLNRAQDDVDSGAVGDRPTSSSYQPRGVIWRATTQGRPILTAPLTHAQLLARLERYYRPYHQALHDTLARMRDEFGHAILLAAHSMPSASGDWPGARSPRADIVPGTLGRTSADPRIIDLVDSHFRDAGLVVRHDDPYRGGFSTGHYGRPAEGWHAIQVEINRKLYVDEVTGDPRPNDFERMQSLVDGLVAKLTAFELT